MVNFRLIFIALLFSVTNTVIASDKTKVSAEDFATTKTVEDVENEFLEQLKNLKILDDQRYDHELRQEHLDAFNKSKANVSLCEEKLNNLQSDREILVSKALSAWNEMKRLEGVVAIRKQNKFEHNFKRQFYTEKMLELFETQLAEQQKVFNDLDNNIKQSAASYKADKENLTKAYEKSKMEFKSSQTVIQSKKQGIGLTPTITDEQIDEIKKIWHQLMYLKLSSIEEDFDSKFFEENKSPLTSDRKERLFTKKAFNKINVKTHPDKFRINDNKIKMTELFKLFAEWKTPELKAIIGKRKLIKSITKFTDFLTTLREWDRKPLIIQQTDINNARKLWLSITLNIDDTDTTDKGHFEKIDDKTKQQINELLNEKNWNQSDNRRIATDLHSFLKSPEEQNKFRQLQKLQDTFASYLWRLKMADSINQPIEENQIATVKKLWHSIICFDTENKSLLDMDSEFQEKIRILGPNWQQASQTKMTSIFDIMQSPDENVKLSSFYKPQQEFMQQLKKLQEMDQQNKVFADSDISRLNSCLNQLPNLNKKDFFQNMDEELHIATTIYSFPHNWKVEKNRTKVIEIFNKNVLPIRTLSSATQYLNEKTKPAISSLDEEPIIATSFVNDFVNDEDRIGQGIAEDIFNLQKASHVYKAINIPDKMFKQIKEFPHKARLVIKQYPAIRPFIDLCYSSTSKTLTPKALNRRIKNALLNLKTSFMPDTILEEIDHIRHQTKLLKQFYNYNWLDRVLYPFHRDDIDTLKTDLPALFDEQLLKDISYDEFKGKNYSEQDLQKVLRINTEIEKLSQSLLVRPIKPLEITFWRTINSSGMLNPLRKLYASTTSIPLNIVNKISPGLWRTQGEKKLSSSFGQAIKNAKQGNVLGKQNLRLQKDRLDIDIRIIKAKALTRNKP